MICIIFLVDIVRFWSICKKKQTMLPLKSSVFETVEIKKITKLPFALRTFSIRKLKLECKKKKNYILAVSFNKK